MTSGDAPAATRVEGGSGAEPGAAPPPRVRAVRWSFPGGGLDLSRPVVMGILNLTPDSFSDGGRIRDVDHALDEAARLVAEGAAILDVGGESTRPGAREVPWDEELTRVLPFLERAAGRVGVPISIDTRHAEVARRAASVGAVIVNDVSGLGHDPAMAETVAESGAGVVLMHMRGTPADMAGKATYGNVVEDVRAELGDAVARATAAGIARERVALDPGLGFAKTPDHSVRLLARLDRLVELGYPVVVGPGRKSFLGALLDVPADARVAGTVSACVVAYLRGARVFRVHDVKPVAEALTVAHAVATAGDLPGEGGR